MAQHRDPFHRLLDRVVRHGPRRVDLEPMPPDPRLPEQRLLDAAARYARIVSGDGSGHRRRDAAAAGVRTVPPTEPSDADAPVWVRRLGEREPGGSTVRQADQAAVPMDPVASRPTVGSGSAGRD